MIIRVNTIISLNGFNQLIVVIETSYVFFPAGTELLIVMWMSVGLQRVNVIWFCYGNRSAMECHKRIKIRLSQTPVENDVHSSNRDTETEHHAAAHQWVTVIMQDASEVPAANTSKPAIPISSKRHNILKYCEYVNRNSNRC
jgi:hypothetical protein